MAGNVGEGDRARTYHMQTCERLAGPAELHCRKDTPSGDSRFNMIPIGQHERSYEGERGREEKRVSEKGRHRGLLAVVMRRITALGSPSSRRRERPIVLSKTTDNWAAKVGRAWDRGF